MQLLKDGLRTLIADLEEAVDLAGKYLPVTDYENDIFNVRKIMGKNPLYVDALKKWGVKFEITMLASECSELIHAALDGLIDRADTSELFEELADVEIMCEQMRVIFGDEDIDAWKKVKLRLLANKLYEGDSDD